MSKVLTEFEPGVVRDIKIGSDGQERRLVAGVDYELACAMLESAPADQTGLIRADNGAIDLTLDKQTFSLFDGQAKVVSDQVDPDGVCVQYVDVAVADVSSWRWIKLRVDGSQFDGYCLLGVKHDTQEAVLARVDL